MKNLILVSAVLLAGCGVPQRQAAWGMEACAEFGGPAYYSGTSWAVTCNDGTVLDPPMAVRSTR